MKKIILVTLLLPSICAATPVYYGPAIKTTATVAAVINKDFVYGATRNGTKNQFYRYNLSTKKVDLARSVLDTAGTWAMLDSGNDVYFTTYDKAALYKHTKKTQKIVKIADLKGEEYAWDMTKDQNGNILVTTSPHAYVYKFNTKNGSLSNLGSVFKGTGNTRDYARSVAAHKGIIYVGTGLVNAGLYAFDPGTGKKINILPTVYRNDDAVYSLSVVGDTLFATLSPSRKMLKMDLSSGKIIELTQDYYSSDAPASAPTGGGTFLGKDGILFEYNPSKDRLSRLTPTGENNLAGSTIIGNKLLGVSLDSELVSINLTTLKKTVVDLTSVGLLKTTAPPFSAIVNKGVAYVSERQLRRFDTRTGKEQYTSVKGEPKAMCVLGNKVYAAYYTAAQLYEHDAADISKANLLWTVGDQQNRPLDIDCYGNTVAMATEPTYGAFGGALAIYNAVTHANHVWRNIVKNHSVQSVDLYADSAYVGTSVFGGTGAPVVGGVAQFAKVDITTKKILWATAATSSKQLKNVVYAGSNSVFGLGDDGMLYQLNSTTGKMTKVVNTKLSAAGKLQTQLTAITSSSAGKIYGISSQAVYKIDKNLGLSEIIKLPNISIITPDRTTGKIYVVADNKLVAVQ